MGDVLLAVLAVAVLVTVAVAALLAVTAAPFLVALQFAERLRVSPARAGALALAGSATGVGLAVATARSAGVAPASVALLLTWLAPVVVAWSPASTRWLGRTGRYER